jgi:DNA-binding NarL/FixJ family response regulator
MISTLLVEDQHLLREGLKLVLQSDPDIRVEAEAETAFQALHLLQQHSFDAVVMDLSLPDQDGLECIEAVRAARCPVPILVVTMHQSAQVVQRAQQVGANGYVLKSASPQELRSALRAVAEGQFYLQDCLRQPDSGPPDSGPTAPQLSRSERQLLQRFQQGFLGDQLAAALGLSTATVDSLVRSLLRKLQAANLDEALHQAQCFGIVLKEPHS